MGIQHIQTCDNCGVSRELRPHEANRLDNGGWRVLNSGSLEATFCNQCVRALVEQALENTEIRAMDGRE